MPSALLHAALRGLAQHHIRALEQRASANRHVITTMRTRLAAGEAVARMYQEAGLAWLERQTEVAEELLAQRKRTAANRPEL
jgi:hypothetical protein